jgi:hypothetical protein
MTHPTVGLQIFSASSNTSNTLWQLNNGPFKAWRPVLAAPQHFEPHTLSMCSGRLASAVSSGKVPELHPAVPKASREPAAVRAPRH